MELSKHDGMTLEKVIKMNAQKLESRNRDLVTDEEFKVSELLLFRFQQQFQPH